MKTLMIAGTIGAGTTRAMTTLAMLDDDVVFVSTEHTIRTMHERMVKTLVMNGFGLPKDGAPFKPEAFLNIHESQGSILEVLKRQCCDIPLICTGNIYLDINIPEQYYPEFIRDFKRTFKKVKKVVVSVSTKESYRPMFKI